MSNSYKLGVFRGNLDEFVLQTSEITINYETNPCVLFGRSQCFDSDKVTMNFTIKKV